jgi:hypothetical protein
LPLSLIEQQQLMLQIRSMGPHQRHVINALRYSGAMLTTREIVECWRYYNKEKWASQRSAMHRALHDLLEVGVVAQFGRRWSMRPFKRGRSERQRKKKPLQGQLYLFGKLHSPWGGMDRPVPNKTVLDKPFGGWAPPTQPDAGASPLPEEA